MFGITLAIVIVTSIWVAYDSRVHRVSINNKPYSLDNGALAWFIFCVLLWIVTFPYYFVKRSKTLKQKQNEHEKIASGMSPDAIEKLRKYKRMFDDGIIPKEYFEAKKKKLMGL
jgi:hypothetical protein